MLDALRLFARERGLWRYALLPLAWAALAYALVVLLIAGASLGLGEWAATRAGFSSVAGGVLGGAVGFVVAIFLGGGIYLALVALISGFGFDRLSAEVETLEFGRPVGQPVGFVAGIKDGVARGILSMILGLVALWGSPTFVIPWLVASFLCLMDFTAPSLLRRGVPFPSQFGRVRRLPGALPFALVSGAILLVPVLNVLALPVLVAAGTILVAEAPPSSGYSPLPE